MNTLNIIVIFVSGLSLGFFMRWQLPWNTSTADPVVEANNADSPAELKPNVVIYNNYYQAATLDVSSGDNQNPEWPDSLNTGGGAE